MEKNCSCYGSHFEMQDYYSFIVLRGSRLVPGPFCLIFKKLGRHFPDHVVQNAAVVEVSELHISVKSHDGMKGFPSVQLLGQICCRCYLISQ